MRHNYVLNYHFSSFLYVIYLSTITSTLLFSPAVLPRYSSATETCTCDINCMLKQVSIAPDIAKGNRHKYRLCVLATNGNIIISAFSLLQKYRGDYLTPILSRIIHAPYFLSNSVHYLLYIIYIIFNIFTCNINFVTCLV